MQESFSSNTAFAFAHFPDDNLASKPLKDSQIIPYKSRAKFTILI